MAEKEFSINFKDYYKIEEEDFFDVIMTRDTDLFVDPFLIYKYEYDYFKDSHDEVIRFFENCFVIAAKTTDKKGVNYKKLENILLFPEVKEVCLGYTNDDKDGSGSGPKYRDEMINSLFAAIEAGLKNFRHFEEIGILCKGIGPDRISDITLNILKHRFISYTQNMCGIHNIEMKKFFINHKEYDYNLNRWEDGEVLLPPNPFDANLGVILVPERFLNDLPILRGDSFIDYLRYLKTNGIRTDINYDLNQRINKEEIIKIAKEELFAVENFALVSESKEFVGYDFGQDSRGTEVLKNKILKEYNRATVSEIGKISDNESFFTLINSFCDSFSNFVEKNEGYRLLWDDKLKRGKWEQASQLLFYGIIKPYCIMNDIDISKETDVGKGPVDFKFSNGYLKRVLIEVKLARNTRYWNGLTTQLPEYLIAEDIKDGIFLIVMYKNEDLEKVRYCYEILEDVKKRTNKNITIKVVDARVYNKISASKM